MNFVAILSTTKLIQQQTKSTTTDNLFFGNHL